MDVSLTNDGPVTIVVESNNSILPSGATQTTKGATQATEGVTS